MEEIMMSKRLEVGSWGPEEMIAYRESKGMTQEEFALAYDMPLAQLQALEDGTEVLASSDAVIELTEPVVTAQDVIDYRNGFGLDQEGFASKFKIPLELLQAWEDGTEKFDPSKIDLTYKPAE